MNNLLKFADFLQKTASEMESGIYDFTENGKCSGCGSCCSNYIPISSKEIKAIKRYVKKHCIKEQIHRYPTAEPVMDFTCPFRSDSEKKCLIYEVRPAICRDFQCDKPRKQIKANKDMYHGRYTVCDMREEFFGRNDKK